MPRVFVETKFNIKGRPLQKYEQLHKLYVQGIIKKTACFAALARLDLLHFHKEKVGRLRKLHAARLGRATSGVLQRKPAEVVGGSLTRTKLLEFFGASTVGQFYGCEETSIDRLRKHLAQFFWLTAFAREALRKCAGRILGVSAEEYGRWLFKAGDHGISAAVVLSTGHVHNVHCSNDLQHTELRELLSEEDRAVKFQLICWLTRFSLGAIKVALRWVGG